MAGESQQVPRAEPDPSVLTTEQLTRALAAERDYIDSQLAIRDQRLDGMDKATDSLTANVNSRPAEVAREIAHLRELTDMRFKAMEALIAEQNAASKEAISKAEKATSESISTNQALSVKTTDAIAENVGDVKTRMDRVEAAALGRVEQKVEGRTVTADNRALIALGITVVVLVLAIASFVIGYIVNKNPSP